MPMNAISILPKVALSQLHSIFHIVQYRFTICHISPPCRLYMMPYSWSLCPILCLEMLTVWRLWLAVFSLLPVSVPLHPHHVSLQAHYIYIMCMHITSTAVHFICFGGSHAGASGTHSHIRTSHYFCTHHLHRCPR